jgi:tetratricopeptide (TPR) repeat protein
MHRHVYQFFFLAVVVTLGAITLSSCAKGTTDQKSTPGSTASSESGKIPVTTSSEEARKEFLQGRDLAEKLLAQDSLQHYDKAISLDPNFASAELGRANSSQTAKEFFDHLNKAVSLADKASEGERLLIVATQAGANGEAVKQKEYLDKLVAAHPNDERANLNIGGYYFGQQEYPKAIEYYKKATELNAQYSPAYNILGYAYRQNGDYVSAEQAFKKYIELIPGDPNPYDSYAELLLKMGKYEDSIVQYRKALAIDPNFVASHSGIAANLMYMGMADEALAQLQKIIDIARSDGDRRTALFGMAVVNTDSGKLDKAVADMDKQYVVAEKISDVAAMTADLQGKGTILVEMGKYDVAKTEFERLLKMTEESSQSQEIKDNTKLFHHYNVVGVMLGKKDVAGATTAAEEFRKGAEKSKNPAQIKQAHELFAMIALAQNDFDKAISELRQTSQQNPYNLYRLCQAYQGKGDPAKAREFCTKAADFNSLPNLNYAFVRTKARKMGTEMKS